MNGAKKNINDKATERKIHKKCGAVFMVVSYVGETFDGVTGNTGNVLKVR